MDDIAAQLSQILSDPAQMAQISALASSLGFGTSPDNAPPKDATEEPAVGFEADFARILPLLAQANGRETQIFAALRPYLNPEDRRRADRALRAAKLSRLAKLALRSLEDGSGGGLL